MSDIGVQTVTRYAKTYSWITDIIKSYDGTEQRIAVRQNPRTTFELEYVLEDDEIRVWKDTLFANLEVGHNLPLWDESVTIPLAMAATDTSVAGDFSLMDTDLAFNILIMSQDGETWESKLVLTRDDTTITFSALVNSYAAGAVIIPWEFSYIDGSPSLNLHTNNAAVLGLKTTASNHRALEGKGAPGNRTPLADLDFSAPVAQTFPTTAATLETALSNPSATASYIWLCDEVSGNLVDEIGGQALVPAASPLHNRITANLWSGTSFDKTAVECTSGTQRFVSASSTFLQAGTTSIAYIYVFRMPSKPGSASGLIGHGSGASVNKGHQIQIGGGTGRLTIWVGDGTNNVPVIAAGDSADGDWHVGMFVIDQTADIAYIYSDTAAVNSASIAAVGDISTSDFFGIGGTRFGANDHQCAYIAVFEGAAAEALDQASLDAFWTHATDPTGLLTTQTRASAIAVQTAADKVGHFTPNTPPIGYHAAFTDTNKLGLYCNSAVTNLTQYSESIDTNWTVSNATTAASVGDAPDGFRSADSITATSANGAVYRNAPGAVANSTYTTSVWVKRNGGSDVGGKIWLRDLDAATHGEQTFTATDTWQLIEVQHTSSATVINGLRNYIYVDTNTESILAWGCQTNLGTGRGAYIRTSGSSAALVKSDYRANGAYVNVPEGEMVAQTVPMILDGATKYLFDHDDAFADQREQHLATNFKLNSSLRGGASGEGSISETATIQGVGAILATRYLWDTVNDSLGFETVHYNNGVAKNGPALPYEFTHVGTTGIAIGQTYAQLSQFDGFIQSIVSYDTVATSAITSYKAKQVLDRRHNSPGTVANTFSQQIHRHDFGHSISQSSAQAYGNIITPRAYTYRGATERQWWKTFLLGVQGRRVSFYAPTYRDDYALVSQPSTGSSTILVTDTPNIDQIWDNSTGHANLALQTDAGLFLTEVTTSLDNADGTYTLTISPALPGTVAGSTINVISFLELVHLGNDSVRFTTAAGVTTVDLTIQTVEA